MGHGIGLAIWERPMISRLVSLEHPHEIKPGMVFALETFWPSTDGWSAARIEEEIVVTKTGHEVITRFPAEELLVAGAPFVTVGGTLPIDPRDRSAAQSAGRGNDCRRRARRGADARKGRRRKLMAISVVMPALEMAQDTGKLVSWLKQEGEPVRKGEMLLEVETDKAVVEVEAAADGILAGVTASRETWFMSAIRSRGSCSREKQPQRSTAVGRTSAPPQRCPPRRRQRRPDAAHASLRGAPPRTGKRGRHQPPERFGPGGEILADDILAAAAASDPVIRTKAESAPSTGG